MAKRNKNLSPKYQPWVDARKRFHLSHAHVQMARELGMNPKKLGGTANHKQEPWKVPLPEFIEDLYFKRFGKTRSQRQLHFPLSDNYTSLFDSLLGFSLQVHPRPPRREPVGRPEWGPGMG